VHIIYNIITNNIVPAIFNGLRHGARPGRDQKDEQRTVKKQQQQKNRLYPTRNERLISQLITTRRNKTP